MRRKKREYWWGGTEHMAIKTTELFWKENETKKRECGSANLAFSFIHCIIELC